MTIESIANDLWNAADGTPIPPIVDTLQQLADETGTPAL